MKPIDLRSDTVTKPSPEMWESIRGMDNTYLGDDVEQEDPTVNNLEHKAAKLLGKEAALFVTSGTQGNLLSFLSQTSPGNEILLEEHSHIFKWEVGGAARIGGLMIKTFSSENGIFQPMHVQKLIRDPSDIHQPKSTLICLENTHNYHGGKILPPELFHSTKLFAKKNNLKFHVDGARIFNAAVAQNIPITKYSTHVDSIQFCLSKGLSCPIGSIIAGTSEFIEKARKYRKMVGGGWRQAGIIAQMGIIALEPKWIQRLKEDHNLAKQLAAGLRDEELNLMVPEPDTNIVMLHMPETIDIHKFVHKMTDQGVLAHTMGERIRLVTHYGINEEAIVKCIHILKNLVKKELM